MPAEPAMPCGTSSLIENALSPTPETGVSIVADFIAVSKESFVRFFGPSATVSVPLADVQMQAETVKPVIGSSTSDGGFVVVPMSACTSDVVTRLAMAVLTDEMPAAAAPLEHVLLLAAAAPLADAAGELVAVAQGPRHARHMCCIGCAVAEHPRCRVRHGPSSDTHVRSCAHWLRSGRRALARRPCSLTAAHDGDDRCDRTIE